MVKETSTSAGLAVLALPMLATSPARRVLRGRPIDGQVTFVRDGDTIELALWRSGSAARGFEATAACNLVLGRS
jgi:endonuclease YncB( thermonuclease family)